LALEGVYAGTCPVSLAIGVVGFLPVGVVGYSTFTGLALLGVTESLF